MDSGMPGDSLQTQCFYKDYFKHILPLATMETVPTCAGSAGAGRLQP